ncbi:hypothetical protein Tco_1527064 [Tanacetum coccineum]
MVNTNTLIEERSSKLNPSGLDYFISFWFNVPSLRYIWVLDKDYETVLALTRPDFISSTMEAHGPYATLAEKLDRQVLQCGIIGSVKSILRQENVNVSFTSVGRTVSTQALMAIDADKKPS